MAKKPTSTGFSLKDELFNRQKVQYLADLFSAADAAFDVAQFVKKTMRGFPQLELKQRIGRIADALEDVLSSDFKTAAKQIRDALPPPLDPNKTDDDFGDFIFAPLGEFIARHGLQRKDFVTSLRTLKAITQRFSMEDAIRRFIDADPERTLAELSTWAGDRNYHVRRLVSEGTRPRLPWSGRLSIDIEVPLPLLDTLHADPTRYVTRSVANHLNDIAKTHPDLVLQRLKNWKASGLQEPAELEWMTRHALRTLVKQGDSRALQMLGYRPDPKIVVKNFTLKPESVAPGEAIELEFEITAERKERLMIDYIVDFMKSNGSHSSRVFKLTTAELSKGESRTFRKRHPFRANATTFTLYPGTHFVTLQVNGTTFERVEFEMEM